MSQSLNELGQPIGAPLPPGWTPPPWPDRTPMTGRFCRVEALTPDHAADLHDAYSLDTEGRNWTYLGYGPFDSVEGYRAWVESVYQGEDPLFFAIMDLSSGRAVGVASYLRITPGSAAIEVGHLNFSPRLQQQPAATEAMFLMMERAFDLGYRRYEWKCDAFNAPSRAAAQRLGFSYEGVFRQATLYKGRNRDTAWYAIIDAEWPALRAQFVNWLSPDNFDENGKQRTSLRTSARPLLVQIG
ncbi:MAG: GNAT family protein [Caldilineaceae bacterium]